MDAGFPPRDQPPARPPADHAAGGRGRPNRGEINDGESGRWPGGGGRGRRAGGRGGRGDLPGSADAEPGRPAPSGAGRAPGTAACSKHGRDHTPRRWQTGDCNVGRSSGGAGRPRRRSARGDLRLDNAFEPWHNSTDRLALSELGAVTRVRWPYRALTPRFSPLPTLPERVAARQLRRLWTPPLLWRDDTPRKQPRPQEFAKPRRRGFAQRPQPSSSSSSRRRRTRQPARCTDTRPELISSK